MSKPIQSAAYQFNSRMPDVTNLSARLNSALVPGGKRSKKGGEVMPPTVKQHAIEISGGEKYNDGRGNIKEFNEGIKPVIQEKKDEIDPTQQRIDALNNGGKKCKDKKGGSFLTSAATLLGNSVYNMLDAGAGYNNIINEIKQFAEGKKVKKMKTTLNGGAVGDTLLPSAKANMTGGTQGSSLPTTLTNPSQEPQLGGKKKLFASALLSLKNGDIMESVLSMEKQLKTLKKLIKKI